MTNKFLNFRCKKCSGTTIKWTRQPPTASRKFRVSCNDCDSFVGWGKAAEHQALLAAGQPFVSAVAHFEAPGATLKDWSSD
jgi:hypothetical protein